MSAKQKSELSEEKTTEKPQKSEKKKKFKLLLAIGLLVLLLIAALVTLLMLSRPVPVETVSFAESQLILKEGQSAMPACSLLPVDATQRTLRWRSSNRSVATVENGIITAHAEGSCMISVTAESGAKDTLTVKVEAPLVEAEMPVIGDWSLFAMAEGEQIRYFYSIEPSLFILENRTASFSYEGTSYALEDWRYGEQEGSFTVFTCEGDGLQGSFYYCLDGTSPYDRCLILPLEDGKTLIFHKGG